jgi:hypothetical protein
MNSIELDANGWRKLEDFYLALLPALGAPPWHGHNWDALNDSIFGGQINKVEPPFRIVVAGADQLSPSMRASLKKAGSIFSDGRAETGVEAYLEFQPPL